jgi:hypothetical protein
MLLRLHHQILAYPGPSAGPANNQPHIQGLRGRRSPIQIHCFKQLILSGSLPATTWRRFTRDPNKAFEITIKFANITINDLTFEDLKVAFMKRAILCIPLMVLLIMGCGTMSKSSRMEKFGQMSKAYEQALLMSNYNAAARFVDPSAGAGAGNPERCKNIKIFQYTIRRVQVSRDSRQVSQDVELQYFLLNSNILHTRQYPEVWRFKEGEKAWLLESGLPDFTR